MDFKGARNRKVTLHIKDCGHRIARPALYDESDSFIVCFDVANKFFVNFVLGILPLNVNTLFTFANTLLPNKKTSSFTFSASLAPNSYHPFTPR